MMKPLQHFSIKKCGRSGDFFLILDGVVTPVFLGPTVGSAIQYMRRNYPEGKLSYIDECVDMFDFAGLIQERVEKIDHCRDRFRFEIDLRRFIKAVDQLVASVDRQRLGDFQLELVRYRRGTAWEQYLDLRIRRMGTSSKFPEGAVTMRIGADYDPQSIVVEIHRQRYKSPCTPSTEIRRFQFASLELDADLKTVITEMADQIAEAYKELVTP